MYTRLVPLKGLRNYNAIDFEKEIERSSNHVLIDVREKKQNIVKALFLGL